MAPHELAPLQYAPSMSPTTLSQILLTTLALGQLAAAGTARVVNNCGATIYYSSVKGGHAAAVFPLAPGAAYSEPILAANNGVSIKVAASASGPVTQFEYTLAGQMLHYDTSNIDGNPFAPYGTTLVPSVGNNAAYPTCVSVVCPPGSYCDAAYNQPNDVRTMVCPGSVDLTFTVCSGTKMGTSGSGSGAGSGSGGGGAAAAAAPAPASSATAAAVPAGTSAAATGNRQGTGRGHRWTG
jgi:hypothetical protein